MSERFYVSTIEGFEIKNGVDGRQAGGRSTPGLSAHVHDRAYNCRVVQWFASEDWAAAQGQPRRRRRALEAAMALAAKLNEEKT